MATGKRKSSSGRKTSGRKTNSGRKKNDMQQESFTEEVILWVILAVSILLFISNFGIGGAIGNAVSSFFFGIFGLSTLPFLSIIVQYIDSITGFSSGNGYLTNNMDYLFKSPLIYIGGFFVFSIILAIIYLVYSFFKAKRG